MNRNDQYRRSRRDRYDRDDNRQSEQFAGRSYGHGDDDRNYGQMGEGGSRDFYGQSDNDSYSGYGYGASSGRYSSRNDQRGYSGGRSDYDDRNQGQDRPRSDYSERSGGYSSGYGSSDYGSRGTGGFGSVNSNDYGGRDFAGPERNYGGRSASDRFGAGGSGYSAAGRSSGGSYSDDNDRSGNERGFFDRAGDEVASWFGDDDAARRREMDHSGRGPTNYTRSDERILEDACDHLTDDRGVDAQNIQVTVENGEVTLDGTVTSRQQKRRAEDCVHDLSGVKHVQNNLRIQDRSTTGSSRGNQSNQSDQSSYNRSDSTTGTLA